MSWRKVERVGAGPEGLDERMMAFALSGRVSQVFCSSADNLCHWDRDMREDDPVGRLGRLLLRGADDVVMLAYSDGRSSSML